MRQHWPLLLILCLAAPLLFAGLGVDYLWEDEGDTAVLAANILKSGVPKAWDGVTFCDSDNGARENAQLVMVTHPWLQYYFVAASFAVLGKSAFAARLPFAICGLATVALVYWLVWRTTAQRCAAFVGAGLTASSAQFLLYARQARNYALYMMLSCALVAVFTRMRSIRAAMLFALVAVLIFHTQPFGIVLVGVLIAIGFFNKQRRYCAIALPLILLFTFPWAVLARAGYAESSNLVRSTSQFLVRLGQACLEIGAVTPLIALLVLALLWTVFRQKILNDPSPTQPESSLMLHVAGAIVIAYAFALAAAHSANDLWSVGLRYAPQLIPITACATAILLARITGGRLALILPIFGLLTFTKLAYLPPWIWAEPRTNNDARNVVQTHQPVSWRDRFFATDLFLFVRDLGRPNPGTLAKTCNFLQEHAQPGERVVTNYEWEPLYFHTRLPQALKILPGYPVYDAARAQRLPDYVFGVDLARWVVLRREWDGYQRYDLAQIMSAIVKNGGRPELVAEIPETFWENREDIHFHRFAGGEYLHDRPQQFLPAQILRVTWPNE